MIDIDKIVKGFTGELKISAKCNGSNINQKIEYKNGNKLLIICMMKMLLIKMRFN